MYVYDANGNKSPVVQAPMAMGNVRENFKPMTGSGDATKKKKSKLLWIILAVVAAILLVVAVVMLMKKDKGSAPVGFGMGRGGGRRAFGFRFY